jgi:hypothetical protein
MKIYKIPYTAGQDSEWFTKVDVQPLQQVNQTPNPAGRHMKKGSATPPNLLFNHG